MKYGFGVDVGGTTIKMGLFSEDGNLLEKWEIKTNTENGGAKILDDICEAVSEKISSKGILRENVAGIGIGVPGPVIPNGTVLKCVNLGWGVFNIEKELSEKAGFPVKAANDANIAALGEAWQGAGKNYDSIIMVTLGTGVGGGIIIDGKILPGIFGAAGEIGHIKVSSEEVLCGCGNTGCLEQYASATGIVRLSKKYLPEGSSLKTAKDIFDSAASGDKVALEIIEEVGCILGTALANLACVMNPEMIVIGGGVSKAGDILLDVVKKHFLKRCFHACEKTEIAIASLGNDAGIYGGAKLIFD